MVNSEISRRSEEAREREKGWVGEYIH